MQRAAMPFEWFVAYRDGDKDPSRTGGKASTHELADKARRAAITRFERSNREWGGNFKVLSSGIQGS